MKHLVAAIVLMISIGILLERMPEATVSRAGVPFRLLQLQLQEPDKSLVMPVTGVPVKRVANTWHAPRSGGRLHAGQDIFAKKGTPVVSATDGIVVRVGTNTLGGKIVSVMGSGGRVYYYAHLDRYAESLTAGDEVSAGDTLGYVGNTGNARTTPPHLHFGVYTATGAMNPLPLLAAPDESTGTSQKPARS
jgi:murein DD-endopeptidase MepM/ murein hydrolase activator NlpD